MLYVPSAIAARSSSSRGPASPSPRPQERSHADPSPTCAHHPSPIPGQGLTALEAYIYQDGNSNSINALMDSHGGRDTHAPIQQLLHVPPPLVVCLVRHINRDGEPVATPTSVERCVRELQASFATPVLAEPLHQLPRAPAATTSGSSFPSMPSPASSPMKSAPGAPKSYPGSCISLQFGKALDVYSNAGAAVMNVFIYAVDEPTSRPRLLGQIAKAWKEQLVKTGNERSCVIMLYHKDLVTAAGKSQAVQDGSRGTSSSVASPVVDKTKLDAAATLLNPYYEELRSLQFGPNQMCAYLPNEAPVRLLERLKLAYAERANKLRAAYEGYLVRKRSMPLDSMHSMWYNTKTEAGAAATTTASSSEPTSEARAAVKADPKAALSPPSSKKKSMSSDVRSSSTSPSRLFSRSTPTPPPPVPTVSNDGSNSTVWSIQQLWRHGYDVATHYLQFGLLREARAIFQRLFLEYYNNSDDFVFVARAETLERLGCCAHLFDARRPGCELGKTGYPKPIEVRSELVEGLLFMAACEMTCATLMYDMAAVKTRYDSFIQVAVEKFEEMPRHVASSGSGGGGEGPSSPSSDAVGIPQVVRSFFLSQCYLSAMRKLWPLCKLTTSNAQQQQHHHHRPATPGHDGGRALFSSEPRHSRAASDVTVERDTLSLPVPMDMDLDDDDLEDTITSPVPEFLRYSMVGPMVTLGPFSPTKRGNNNNNYNRSGGGDMDSEGEWSTVTPLPYPLGRLLGLREGSTTSSTHTQGYFSGGIHTTQVTGEYVEDLLLGILATEGDETINEAISYLVSIAHVIGLVPPSASAVHIDVDDCCPRSKQRLQQLRKCCVELANLAVSARETLSEVGCYMGYADIAMPPHSSPCAGVGSQEIVATATEHAHSNKKNVDDDACSRHSHAEKLFSNVDELRSPHNALRFWRVLTAMSAVSLRVAGQHRREFNLYVRLALTYVHDNPGVAASLAASRLIPFVCAHGWWHMEYFVRRLYVESQDRVLDFVLGHEKSWNPEQRSRVWMHLFGSDVSHMLYRECVLFLIGSLEHVLDPAMHDPANDFSIGSLDQRVYAKKDKKAWWKRLLQVDRYIEERLPSGKPLECPLGILLQKPHMWASREYTPVETLAAKERNSSSGSEGGHGEDVKVMIRADLDDTVHFYIVTRCLINPLLQSDGVSLATSDRLSVVLESRKDWEDAVEPTHVVQIDCDDFHYDESTCQWAARFKFTPCHAGTYRLRCIALHNQATVLSHYPKRATSHTAATQMLLEEMAAAEEAAAFDRSGAHSEFTGYYATHNPLPQVIETNGPLSSLPAVHHAMCTQPLLYVPEPASGIHLNIRAPSDEHFFTDIQSFLTLEIEMEEPLHVPATQVFNNNMSFMFPNASHRRALLASSRSVLGWGGAALSAAAGEGGGHQEAAGDNNESGCVFEASVLPVGPGFGAAGRSMLPSTSMSLSMAPGGISMCFEGSIQGGGGAENSGPLVAMLSVTPPKLSSSASGSPPRNVMMVPSSGVGVGGGGGGAPAGRSFHSLAMSMSAAPGTSFSKWPMQSIPRGSLRAPALKGQPHVYRLGILVDYGETPALGASQIGGGGGGGTLLEAVAAAARTPSIPPVAQSIDFIPLSMTNEETPLPVDAATLQVSPTAARPRSLESADSGSRQQSPVADRIGAMPAAANTSVAGGGRQIVRVTIIQLPSNASSTTNTTTKSGGGGGASSSSNSNHNTCARTLIPVDVQTVMSAIPTPKAIPLLSDVTPDEHQPLPLAVRGKMSIYPRRECTFGLEMDKNTIANNNNNKKAQEDMLVGSRKMEVLFPLLPLYYSNQTADGGAGAGNGNGNEDDPALGATTVSFSCLRGRESCTSSTSLQIPFKHAIEVEYTFRHFQSRVYCLVRLRNVLKETSLWMRGVLLHVLDPTPSYEVIRVCEVYDTLLNKEWKPQEVHQLLFELALCPSFHPSGPLLQHRVQVQVFYSDWVRTFIPSAPEARIVLRPERHSFAESVRVESLTNEPSSVPVLHLNKKNHDISNSVSFNNDTATGAASVPPASMSDINVPPPPPRIATHVEGSWGNSSELSDSLRVTSTVAGNEDRGIQENTSSDGGDGNNNNNNNNNGSPAGASESVKYSQVAMDVLSSTCNSYYGSEAVFESKHLCLFSAVMYAESPWTQRFGAATNYNAPLSAHNRTMSAMSSFAPSSSQRSLVLMTDAMVDQPADFIFVAGEPVCFCVRLEPHPENWPEDSKSVEDFFIQLHFNPQQWMVIGKQRKRRTLSVMAEDTVNFTAVPLLPPTAMPPPPPPSSSQTKVTSKSASLTEEGTAAHSTTSTTRAGLSASHHPFKGQLAGSLVQDEGVLQTPTIKVFWARKQTSSSLPTSRVKQKVSFRTPTGTSLGGAQQAEAGNACEEDTLDEVLLDLVLFRTWVKVCKKIR